MTVSEKNRRFFEGVGLEAIRREVTVGNNYYIPIDPAMQAEAREWVAEREQEIRDADRARTTREKQTLKYTRWTLVAAIAAALVGIARYRRDGYAGRWWELVRLPARAGRSRLAVLLALFGYRKPRTRHI